MNKVLGDISERSLEEKRELLAQLLQKQTNHSKIYPVSFAQQRLWFLVQLEPGSTAYHMAFAVRLDGALRRESLERAFSEVVRRHESLRTTFVWQHEQPVQLIAAVQPLMLPWHDLRALDAPERERQLRALMAMAAQQRFDLQRGPLLRVELVQLGEQEHVVVIVMHHIISDGWSMSIFTQEMIALYDAYVRGAESPLGELAIQYADYAVWQRAWLQGEVLEAELGYWRRQLHGVSKPLRLPPDYPQSDRQDKTGSTQWLKFSDQLKDSLGPLWQDEGVTQFMLMLSALLVLLSRLTGEEDIVVGSPVAGRNQPQTETLIGYFLNTLVLRTDLSGNPTFRQLLKRVREICLDAYAHQDLPLEKLVEELQPERSMNHPPLFDILLNQGNTPEATLESPGLGFSFLDIGAPEAKYSMTIYCWGNAVQLVYPRAMYSAERMRSFLDELEYLLEQIVAEPGRPIRSYSLITPASRARLPDPTWSLPEPRYALATEMFLSWAQRWPEHYAVHQKERAWTYGELSESAHEIASMLLAQGLKRGEVVAVCGAPSFGIIASTMAVLLSGGVLLLMDHHLPSNRLRLMLDEAGVTRILFAGELRQADLWMEELSATRVIYVDPVEGRMQGEEKQTRLAALPMPEVLPDDAAYITFTSGTTGTPKGIRGSHKGLGHFLNWQRTTFEIGPGDRVAQLTNYSFDVIFREIFLPLTSGAALCLPEAQHEFGAEQVLTWLEQEKISVLHTVPSLAQSWLAHVPPGVALNHVQHLFFAGEPLTSSLVNRWRETFPLSGNIVNLYGPSETTLAKCFYRVPAEVLPGVQPIGWPLPETQLLILSEEGQLCGIDEPGEIVVRTPFRSLGYTNHLPEQAKRFVPNHFRQDEQDLLYYTGDRGHYRADGSLAILGRTDHQVKIHGIRLELGEIEVVLGQHPQVQECVVSALEDESGEKRLVAYVVSDREPVPTVSALRSFLGNHLPLYAMPSSFVRLDHLPLMPNGKVNRQALPVPDQSRPSLENTYVHPGDVLELRLVQIWEELLDVSPIGTTDNFFDLGGHSLMTVQLMFQIEKQFAQKLPLAVIFQGPTIKQLASILRRKADLRRRSPLVAIQPHGPGAPFYCVHPAGGNVVCYTDLAREMGKNQPFYGLQTPGYEGEQAPLTNLVELARCYVEAITAFQPQPPYLIGGWSLGAVVAFEMARQFHARGQPVSLLAMMDHKAPLSLQDKPTERDDVTLLLQAIGDELTVLPEELEGLDTEGQLAYIVIKAKQAGMMPDDITVAQVRAYIHIYKANTHALRDYTPNRYAGRLTLFRASDQVIEDDFDATMGWQQLALDGVEVLWVPGRHSNMVRAPHATALAKRLNACIAKVLSESETGKPH